MCCKKNSKKNTKYMLNYFSPCSYGSNLSQNSERNLPVSPSFLLVSVLPCVFLHSKTKEKKKM